MRVPVDVGDLDRPPVAPVAAVDVPAADEDRLPALSAAAGGDMIRTDRCGGTSGSKYPAGTAVQVRGHTLFGQVFTPVTWRIGQRDRMIRAFCAPEFPQYGVG